MSSDVPSTIAQGEGVSHARMELPYACHRRILRHCRALRTLRLHLAECGQSLEAQMVGHVLLRFFDNEVPQHCDDEEQDLFPALNDAMQGCDAVDLRELTRGATEQHRALASEWGQASGAAGADRGRTLRPVAGQGRRRVRTALERQRRGLQDLYQA